MSWSHYIAIRSLLRRVSAWVGRRMRAAPYASWASQDQSRMGTKCGAPESGRKVRERWRECARAFSEDFQSCGCQTPRRERLRGARRTGMGRELDGERTAKLKSGGASLSHPAHCTDGETDPCRNTNFAKVTPPTRGQAGMCSRARCPLSVCPDGPGGQAKAGSQGTLD